MSVHRFLIGCMLSLLLVGGSVSPTFAQVSTARFTLPGPTMSIVVGHASSLTLGLHVPTTAKITGVDALLTGYDSSIISLSPVTFPSSGTIFPSNFSSLKAPNTLKFSSSITQAGTFFTPSNTGAYPYAQFSLSALRAGSTTIRFSCTNGATNDSNIVSYGTGADVIDCAALPTLSVTVTAPTPTPTPTTAIPMCLTITSDVSAPVYGQSVRFTCGQVVGANSYAFRYRIQGTSDFGTIAPQSVGSNVSVPFTYTKAGTYDIECQACVGTICSAYSAW